VITDYTKLPTLLQSRKHWVLCGVPGAADPKHPRQAKHPQWGADSTNPATWADFATASAAVMLDDADGMGYVFAKDDGLVFIDGDHCLGADGRPLPPFNKWLTMLPGYCERSRSGTGLHFIVRGTLPDGCKHKKHINGGEMAVELYDCNRYVALTGDLWGEQTPLEDAPSAQAGIDVILQQMGMLADDGPADALPDQPDRPEEEIQAIIADALQRDGDFAQLWSCTEHPGKLGDESKDDIAFCTAAWRATSYQLSAGDLMHGLDASPWAETKDNTAPKWHWDKWHGTGHRSTGDYRKNTALRAYQKAKRQEAAALEGFKSLAPGALPGEVLQLKLSDLSEVEEGTKFADNVVGGLLYNASLGWLAWDGCRFAPDECRTRLLAQLFTERQLKAAAADLQQAAGAAAQDAENTELAAQAKRAKEVYTFVKRCRQTNGINHLLTEAKPHLAVAVDDLDADPFLLNTPGGIVDLRTGELRAPDPAARCTKVTAVAPGSDGAELWWGFLDTVTCGNTELAEYLQTVAGMAVLGKVFTETLLIATGDGGNGKSTFFNTLARVLGDYSTSINPSLLLTGNRGNVGAEVAVLRGVRLALAAETEEGQRLESSTVKRLCSTDRIAANPKYLTPFTFTPSHTLLMFTNFLPRVGSSDKGTWSRLTVLPFNAHLRDTAGERKDYAEVLFTQAGGAVLSWMVEGARRFIANGYKLTPPAVVREALADYRKSCDWLGGFLTECCELGENYATNGRELYARYTAYCQVNGDYRRDNRDFAHAMQNAGYERKHTMKGWQYYGLRLHSELPQE